MKALWGNHGGALSKQLHPPIPFSKAEKKYLEDLTGRMPLFLRLLGDTTPESRIQLTIEAQGPLGLADIVKARGSPDLAEIPPRLTQIYDRVWKSDEVRTVVRHITRFWENNRTQLAVE